jgi:hypothetical protein
MDKVLKPSDSEGRTSSQHLKHSSSLIPKLAASVECILYGFQIPQSFSGICIGAFGLVNGAVHSITALACWKIGHFPISALLSNFDCTVAKSGVTVVQEWMSWSNGGLFSFAVL